LAGYYQDQKDFLKAIPYYEEVLKLDDKNLRCNRNFGNIYTRTIQTSKSKQKKLFLSSKSRTIRHKSSGIYYNISCIYSLQKEIEKAIQYLDKAIYMAMTILNGCKKILTLIILGKRNITLD
jgi:tetratricopeptide (TPR) repeat protein